MEALWIGIAFIFGFIASRAKLPPMLGYLLAGFVLNYFGAESGEVISSISDLGILLLLFTIGLKLNPKTLIQAEIWAGAGIHMILSGAAIFAGVFLLSLSGLQHFASLNWQTGAIIAFAMSFSSTVFAVKVLETKGEVTSLHGRISIGILIMQDLFAVLFMVFAAGKIPEIYAIGLPLALIIMRPLLFYILKKSGHGELLILFGFFAAVVVGGELFRFTGLKADLGALVVGMMLSGHSKSEEMSKDLLKFKDIFLIGFFLSIGFSGDVNTSIIISALIVLTAISVKSILYFLVLTRFKLRSRTAFLTSLTLSNFSEFGLLVAVISANNNWIPEEWVIIIAIALSISFIISSPANTRSYEIFNRIHNFLYKFQRSKRLSYDRTYDIGDAEILIFGMGDFGKTVYNTLREKYGRIVLGLDYDEERVKTLKEQGMQVINDDATDYDFWEKINVTRFKNNQVQLIMLCMGNHKSNMYAVKQLKKIGFKGMIASTAYFNDQVDELKKHGVHSAYNIKIEAGAGFANHVCSSLCDISYDREKHEQV